MKLTDKEYTMLSINLAAKILPAVMQLEGNRINTIQQDIETAAEFVGQLMDHYEIRNEEWDKM